MNRTRWNRWIASPLALLLLAAGGALAPAAAQEELPGVFGEVIDVRVVNIEVVVTDRGGNRVTGLQPSDFRLRVDGREVPIDYFTEVFGGVAVEPEGEVAAATQGLPSVEPGQPVGTSYLVFIDDYFPIQRDRNRVLDSLRDQLPLLNPEDLMAIVAYDGKRLEMLSSWNDSVPALERALKEASRRRAHGLERIAERKRLLTSRGLGAFEQLAVYPGGDIGYRLTPEERSYAELLTSQIQRVVGAASATLRSFAQPPGRKVMLALSGGWPFDPPQFTAEDQTVPVLDSDFDRGFELFKPLADTANLLGYTVYPIDVPGLQGAGPDASIGPPPPPSPASLSQEQEVQGALSYLAVRTGGRAMINALRVNALGRAATDTRSYYWLGFTPERLRDDEEHRIEVEVLKPGLRVRSRRGFLDFSRQAEVTSMVESTLLFGNAPAAGGLPVKVGEVKRKSRNRIEVPLSVAIPVSALTVLPSEGGYASEVELRIAVLDEDGNTADIPVVPLRLDSEDKPAADGLVRYDTSLTLRRKKHEVVVALYDPASGRILSNHLEIKP